jgi:hydrogenase maturation protease
VSFVRCARYASKREARCGRKAKVNVKTVVLGIGNLLLTDEGVGVHVARALQSHELGKDASVLEVGTSFLEALPAIECADRVIIVDAMQGGEAPGTVYRVPFDDCARPECIASMHGFDLSRVIYLAGRQSTPEVIVIGVEPARIEWGTEISEEVRTVLPELLEVIRTEISTPVMQSGLEGRCRCDYESRGT